MPIPRIESELVVWLNNFAANLQTHAARLGIPQPTVNQVVADAAMMQHLVGDLVPAYQLALQERVAFKNLLKDGPLGSPEPAAPAPPSAVTSPALVSPGIMPRTRQLVARIKTAATYTEAIGRSLGIVGDEPAAPTGPPKPTAKATAQPGSQVKIEFNKGGFNGVIIEGRRGAETAWTPLGTDNFSPYVDTRPPLEASRPELREYRLRFLDRDEPVGDWSDIISTSTTP